MSCKIVELYSLFTKKIKTNLESNTDCFQYLHLYVLFNSKLNHNGNVHKSQTDKKVNIYQVVKKVGSTYSFDTNGQLGFLMHPIRIFIFLNTNNHSYISSKIISHSYIISRLPHTDFYILI